MKKLVLGTALLAALLGGAFWNAWALERDIRALSSQAEAARTLAAGGDYDSAAGLLRRSLEDWERTQRRVRLYSAHSEAEGVSDAFRQCLAALASRGEGCAATFDELGARLSALGEMERLRLDTFL